MHMEPPSLTKDDIDLRDTTANAKQYTAVLISVCVLRDYVNIDISLTPHEVFCLCRAKRNRTYVLLDRSTLK